MPVLSFIFLGFCISVKVGFTMVNLFRNLAFSISGSLSQSLHASFSMRRVDRMPLFATSFNRVPISI
jgi:hypothetical protein